MKKISILHGANLNLVGKREPSIYGTTDFQDYLLFLQKEFPQIALDYFQTNHEGFLIDKLHEIGFSYDGIILNAGAFTHTSLALHDAIKAIRSPVIEVHISNIFAREPFRHHSYIAPACVGSISGLGLNGYHLALHYFMLNEKNNS